MNLFANGSAVTNTVTYLIQFTCMAPAKWAPFPTLS